MTAAYPAKPTNAFATQPTVRLAASRLAVRLLPAGMIVAAVAAVIAAWVTGTEWLTAAPLAAGVVAAGTATGLAFLALFAERPVLTWAFLVISGSVIRMAVAVGVALAVYTKLQPDISPYWSGVLAGLIAVLAVETGLTRRELAAVQTGSEFKGV